MNVSEEFEEFTETAVVKHNDNQPYTIFCLSDICKDQ